MKLTQDIIDKIQEAMLHKKKDGTVNWKDTDEIEVQLAGTFAADRFIVIKNKTKDPVVSAAPHPHFDYERGVFTKDGREEYMKEYATNRVHDDIKKSKCIVKKFKRCGQRIQKHSLTTENYLSY